MVVFRKKNAGGYKRSYSGGMTRRGVSEGKSNNKRRRTAPSKFYRVLLSVPNSVLSSKNDSEYVRCSFIHPERGTVKRLYLFENRKSQLINLLKSVINSYSGLDKSAISNLNGMIEIIQGLEQDRKSNNESKDEFSMSMFVSALFEQIGAGNSSGDGTISVLVPVTVAETEVDGGNFTYSICNPDKSKIYLSDTEFSVPYFSETNEEQ